MMRAIPLPPPVERLGRRERKRRETANHIVATAVRLFEALGYEAVTMERIAAEADIAKGTLYGYFPVKEAILAHQYREEIAAGMAAHREALERQPNFAARMRYLVRASAAWHRSRRAYLPHYLRFRMASANYREGPPAREEYRSGTYRILEALFREGQRVGEVRPELDSGSLAVTFEFMLAGAILFWLNQPRTDLTKHFELALDVLLRGISVPATAGRAQIAGSSPRTGTRAAVVARRRVRKR